MCTSVIISPLNSSSPLGWTSMVVRKCTWHNYLPIKLLLYECMILTHHCLLISNRTGTVLTCWVTRMQTLLIDVKFHAGQADLHLHRCIVCISQTNKFGDKKQALLCMDRHVSTRYIKVHPSTLLPSGDPGSPLANFPSIHGLHGFYHIEYKCHPILEMCKSEQKWDFFN